MTALDNLLKFWYNLIKLNGAECHRKRGCFMALTKNQVREILSAAGVASERMDEAVNKIVDGHVTSINALREERDGYKADAEKLPGVQKELDDLKAATSGNANLQEQLTKAQNDLKDYKAQVQKEKDTETKKSLYRGILKELKVDEKRFDSILKVTDIDSMKLNKDGQLDGVDDIKKSVQTEWADFIVSEKKQGADVETPPAGGDGSPKPVSRAAQLAQKYNANLYGVAKE